MTDPRGQMESSNPSAFCREVRQGFRIFRRNSPFTEKALASLLPDPDRLLAAGRPVESAWKSPATEKIGVDIAGSSCLIKRYNPVDIRYRLKNAFRFSKAQKAFLAGWRFLEAGLPTPDPLVCLEERNWRLLGRSYLIFPFVGNGGDLLACWPRWDAERRIAGLKELAGILGRMHSLGILHGDLNWRNILVDETGSRRTFLIVDLDGCRFAGGREPARAERDLAHFLRDLQRVGAFGEAAEGFLRDWRTAAGLVGHVRG